MKFFDPGPNLSPASVLAFGCASVMGYRDRATSRRALDAAWDHGINFFDLARSYGYGQAESLFGQFARGRRDRLVIGTKFGIDPDASLRANGIRLLRGGAGGLRHLQWPFGKRPDRHDPLSEHWVPARLRTTLERSLRELRTDYVDILWLHSPPADITCNNALFDELDKLVAAGRIRGYGLSTDAVSASRALGLAKHGIGAIQHAFCPVAKSTAVLAASPGTVVLNHIFGGRGTFQQAAGRLAALDRNPALPPAARDKILAAQPAAVLADILFNGALAAASAQCGVVAMFTPGHLARNAAIAGVSAFTREELILLRSELEKQAA